MFGALYLLCGVCLVVGTCGYLYFGYRYAREALEKTAGR